MPAFRRDKNIRESEDIRDKQSDYTVQAEYEDMITEYSTDCESRQDTGDLSPIIVPVHVLR